MKEHNQTKQKDGCCGGHGGDSCGCSHDAKSTKDTSTHKGECCSVDNHNHDQDNEADHDLSAQDIATINRILGDVDGDLDEEKDLSDEEVETLKKIFKITE